MASFSSSAFSTNAFSELAFDFGGTPPPPSTPTAVPTRPDKGEHSYISASDKYREEEYQRSIEAQRAALAEIETEIAESELLNKKKLRTRSLAKNAAEEAVLEAMLQQEINVLRMERARLMRLIDDEETILVLLLSLPLH